MLPSTVLPSTSLRDPERSRGVRAGPSFVEGLKHARYEKPPGSSSVWLVADGRRSLKVGRGLQAAPIGTSVLSEARPRVSPARPETRQTASECRDRLGRGEPAHGAESLAQGVSAIFCQPRLTVFVWADEDGRDSQARGFNV